MDTYMLYTLASLPVLALAVLAYSIESRAARWALLAVTVVAVVVAGLTYWWITTTTGWWQSLPPAAARTVATLARADLIDGRNPLHLAALPAWVLLAAASAVGYTVAGVASMWPHQPRTIRGADVAEASRAPGLSGIMFGGAEVPADKETRGFLLLGSPGTGKTQQIHRMLRTARGRGDRAIVVDAGGDLLSRHYREGDIILSTEDARSVAWSAWADLVPGAEFDLAKSCIPDGHGSAVEWSGYAQGFVSGVLERLAEREDVTTGDLVHAIEIASLEELDALVQGLGASRLTAEGNERMAQSVLAIISTAFRSWRALPADAGKNAFSIADWVRSDTRDGQWLWLPYSAPAEATTAPLRRAWIDIAIRAALTLRPDQSRRLWLVLDELAACGQLPSLGAAARQGRKYGLVPVAGFQVNSQVEELYGDKGAQSILSCLGNRLTLRVDDERTAQYAARSVGKMEQTREQVTHSANTGGQGGSSGTSRTTVQEVRDAILDSEIMTLPDMHGLVKVAGQQWRRARIKYIDLPEVAPGILPVQRKRATPPPARPARADDALYAPPPLAAPAQPAVPEPVADEPPAPPPAAASSLQAPSPAGAGDDDMFLPPPVAAGDTTTTTTTEEDR